MRRRLRRVVASGASLLAFTGSLIAAESGVAAKIAALKATDRTMFDFVIGRTQVCMENGAPGLTRITRQAAAAVLIGKCGTDLHGYLRRGNLTASDADDVLEAMAYHAITRNAKQ